MSSCKPSSLQTFEFESNQKVRTVTGLDGEPWFVAKDVAEALEYRMASDMTRTLAEDEKGTHVVRTPGGEQEMTVMSEPGLYRAVFLSKSAKAEPFRRWVTEVLRSIRKTGSFSMPGVQPAAQARALPTPTEEKVAAHFLAMDLLARRPGVRAGIAMAVGLEAIHTDTGLTMEPYRKALPPAAGPIADLNPTRLAVALGMPKNNGSAAKVNRALTKLGLHEKDGRNSWCLTKKGAAFGEQLPFKNGGRSGYQILWLPSVLDLLRPEFPSKT
ncbi:BRO-N domain-containing protein [Corallococcus silvisoli]|uniref:BRO-N domain-containing protein n=1 Tax=Corallococcus silvisoli TaxID=2697031 RepID=UPI0013784A73|nr:Bro-N domain-containing protein [Corallococcus silvisoli]NBD09276.1 hypothetical protein [Corallococcus silvisoli]